MSEYFCSWSGGADSTATVLLALEHGEPLTAMVYCEVMFDEHTSGEVPEHVNLDEIEDEQMVMERMEAIE